MKFLIILAVTAALIAVLQPVIKKYPVIFYVLAIVLDIAFLYSMNFPVSVPVKSFLILLVRRCQVAFAIFIVVMFTGVFKNGSKLRSWLQPIRGYLSITACLLACGHIAAYLVPFVSGLFGSNQSQYISIAIIASLGLCVLLVILGVTSFEKIRYSMQPKTWHNIQRWAYLFYALIFVHVVFLLVPPALLGGATAQKSIIVYVGIFVIYTAMRLYRTYSDKKVSAERQSASSEEATEAPAEA